MPKDYLYATRDTIRTDFLVLPGKLTKRGSQNLLVLPQDYHYQEQFKSGSKESTNSGCLDPREFATSCTSYITTRLSNS